MPVGSLRSDGAGVGGQEFAAAVGQWAERTKGRLDAVLRESASTLAETVIVGSVWGPGTPVDTGYARASWVASLNAPSDVLPAGPPPTAAGRARGGVLYSSGLDAVGGVIGQFGAGQVLYLQNNTAYLAYLEYGLTVPKASDTPPGWVAQASRQWPAIVAATTRRLRQSVAEQSAANTDAAPVATADRL